MKTEKLAMVFLFAVGLLLMSAVAVSAKTDKDSEKNDSQPVCGNEGFACECANFYNNMSYYTIAKFSFKEGEGNYTLDEKNSLYSYYDIDVSGDFYGGEWESDEEVFSVLVKAANERAEFDGGKSGEFDTGKHAISHVTFCGYRSGNNGGGGNGWDNGVPEFPGVAVGAAVLVATLGLVFLRKN